MKTEDNAVTEPTMPKDQLATTSSREGPATNVDTSQVANVDSARPSQDDYRTCFMKQKRQPGSECKLLARGGNGNVYRFFSPLENKHVACKMAIKKENDPDYRKVRPKYEKEFTIMKMFNENSSVVKAIHFDDGARQNGPPIIFMEIVEGGDLSEAISEWSKEREGESRVSLTFKRKILEISKYIAEVMIDVHAMKVIHGDLKPANLLRDADGRLKLADFGHAMAEADKKKIPVGTTRFCAPEVIKAISEEALWSNTHEYWTAVDVYAFGITLFELASCRAAYPPPDDNLTGRKYDIKLWGQVWAGTRPDPLPSEFGAKFCKLMEGCWQKDPGQRPSFPDILNTLNGIEFDECEA